MSFIPSWTDQFKVRKRAKSCTHRSHMGRPTFTPSNKVVCLLTFVWLNTYRNDVKCRNLVFWPFRNLCYVWFNSKYPENQPNKVKLKIDSWLEMLLSTKFNFWSVHEIMNIWGAKLSWSPNYFARDPKCSWFHEQTKKQIYFLNIPPENDYPHSNAIVTAFLQNNPIKINYVTQACLSLHWSTMS